MTRMWIVVGDATSSGGRVLTGSLGTDVDGRPVSRVGDKATCPLHKSVFLIVDGDPTTIIDGQPVALHGSKLACGCMVLALQQVQVFMDTRGAEPLPTGASRASGNSAIAAASRPVQYNEAFVLRTEEGKALVGRRYKIVREGGAVEEGTTDSEGRTHLVRSDHPEAIEIQLGEEGP